MTIIDEIVFEMMKKNMTMVVKIVVAKEEMITMMMRMVMLIND